jgi:DNA ligase (NAD+)
MESIISRLESAAAAYYNSGVPLMSDEAYDALVDELRLSAPDHPFLNRVGAPPASGATTLPYKMQSLDKVKPGSGELRRFLGKACSAGAVLSEKLDGISALWIGSTRQLFLRGDDLIGTDVSALAARGIQGLVPAAGMVVRGELVVPRAGFTGASLVRNWVNGILHRDDADDADIQKIRFVAYELLEPPLSRPQQFVRLRAAGFETAWWMRADICTEELLQTTFTERRAASPYETDGIVVAAVTAAPASDRARPTDKVAFKMPVADEIVQTTVVAVLWAVSAQGYLIPRIQIEPVEIHGARIEFCSAHNARFIETTGLGPGAVVRIRRSGDVIPAVHEVVRPAAETPFPTVPWAWDATRTHAVATSASAEQSAALLTHFVTTIGVTGCAAGQVKKLVEGGIRTAGELLSAGEENLRGLVGEVAGRSLAAQLPVRLAAATELVLMVASRVMPRGVGDTKLMAVFAAEPDYRRWHTVEVPAGWSRESFDQMLAALPAYEIWRRTLGVIAPPAPSPAARGVAGCVVFTGFRDAALAARAEARGYTFADAVTKNTSVLVTADGAVETVKVKKAIAAGVKVMTKSEFEQNV